MKQISYELRDGKLTIEGDGKSVVFTDLVDGNSILVKLDGMKVRWNEEVEKLMCEAQVLASREGRYVKPVRIAKI